MTIRPTAVALLAAAALAGCGGDDSSSSPTSTASSEAPTAQEAKQAYTDFYAGLYAGDAEAVCAVLTDGAEEEFVEAGKADDAIGGETCEEVAANTSKLMQSFGTGDPEITFGTFGVGSAGDAAIEATVADGPPRMIPVVREGDAVLIDGFGD